VLPHRLLDPGEFGGLMVCTGLLALLLATWGHPRSMNSLRASYGPMPHSVAAMIGLLIGALGLAALAAMLFGF
jgi:hypothetical protein